MTPVTIVEVGPRDGLQNEAVPVATADKLELIGRLASAGLRVIESTSFVHPRRVPQLADAEAVMAQLDPQPGMRYPVLAPNLRGVQRAIAAGAAEVAVFVAASESFNRRNINRSTKEAVEDARQVVGVAREAGLRVRAYVSTVCGCPYQGEVAVSDVVELTETMLVIGADEICLGDTIGVGTPFQVRRLIAAVSGVCDVSRLAVHMHDTYGQGLANSLVAIESGVRIVDTSVAGLGGCPYAPGASGNLATEDLVYALRGSGLEPDIDLGSLVETGRWISNILGRRPASKVAGALLAAASSGAAHGGEEPVAAPVGTDAARL